MVPVTKHVVVENTGQVVSWNNQFNFHAVSIYAAEFNRLPDFALFPNLMNQP